jgi:hypothetical protein
LLDLTHWLQHVDALGPGADQAATVTSTGNQINVGSGVGVNEMHCHRSSDVESTRRAVRKLEAAGLFETRMIYRNDRGIRQIGVRLAV